MTGFDSKRQMAADKLQDGKCKLCVDGCAVCDARAQPVQEREWVGLTPEETSGFTQHEMTVVKYVSKVLQEKNG